MGPGLDAGGGGKNCGVEFSDRTEVRIFKRWSLRDLGLVTERAVTVGPWTRSWCACGWSESWRGFDPAAGGRRVQRHFAEAHQ